PDPAQAKQFRCQGQGEGRLSRTRCGHREKVPGLPAEILVERFLLPSTEPVQAILRRALRHRHVLHPPLLTPQRVAGLLGRATMGRKERPMVSFTLHPLRLLRVPPTLEFDLRFTRGVTLGRGSRYVTGIYGAVV